jgi:hypothetical protein
MRLTALLDWHSPRERTGGKGVTGPRREAVKVWWNLSGLKMRLMEEMQAQLKRLMEKMEEKLRWLMEEMEAQLRRLMEEKMEEKMQAQLKQ